jgi:two-component system chemotaxis sensor kinase CheA
MQVEEFVAGFLLEADEHLHAAHQNLVAVTEAMQQGRAEPRAVRELFRSLHTIKGLSSMVGAEPIVEISHEMEGILRAADQQGGRLEEETLTLLLQGARAIEERVRAIAHGGLGAVSPAPRALVEALALAQRGEPPVAPAPLGELSLPDAVRHGLSAADLEQLAQAAQAGRRVVLVEFRPSPQRAAAGVNITSVRARLATLGELIKVVPRAVPDAPTGIAFWLLMVSDASDEALFEAAGGSDAHVEEVRWRKLPSQPAPPAAPADPELGDWAASEQSIRVSAHRLDEALERLSELVVTGFKLRRAVAALASHDVDVRELNAVVAEHGRQLRRLRDAITEARMVPLSDLLQRLPLVVRGLTRDAPKAVDVHLQTGSAEVDKAVADKLFPAILHLVRNAVDHAIEPFAERERAHKPKHGQLFVLCDDSAGTNLVLTVRDDGRGIDREAVASKLGCRPAANDEELLEQITRPGLSTREDVTTSSGRGMGMDIVRRTVEMLGGGLSVQSVPTQGTTFTLRVPVNVTLVEVFSFEAGGQVFVAPVAMVEEIVEVDAARVVSPPTPSADGPPPRLVRRRGDVIPLLALEHLLRRNTAGSAVDAHATMAGANVPEKALVVHHGRNAVALGVSRMLGQQEVVVRPLHDALVRVTGISGAADLGDGRPTLVLDLLTLGSVAAQQARAAP